MAEEDDFIALVGGDVAPIQKEERVMLARDKKDSATLKTRREAAAIEVAVPDDPLAGEPVTLMEPMDVLEFKRPGVQHGVYRNVRLGKYAIDARLDLHKMNVERARQTVYQFITDCVANDVRTALISHGKSEGRDTPALLKSYVAHWLPQMNDVLAFHTALKQHGGYGATYVLLKKSEKKKQKNREVHNKNSQL